METLFEYQFDIQHRPGKKHGNADDLFRQGPCRQCGRIDDENLASYSQLPSKRKINLVQLQPKWTAKELNKAQRADPDLAPVIKVLESQRRPTHDEISARSPVSRRYLIEWDRLHVIDEVFYRADAVCQTDTRIMFPSTELIDPPVFLNLAATVAMNGLCE